MGRKRLTLIAALGLSIGAAFLLGAATAHADEVLPGLTCDEQFLSTDCTNTTKTDYMVVQTRECAGGTYTTTHPGYGYDAGSGGFTFNAPMTEYHSVEPSVEYVRVFVPANNTGSGPRSSCDLETLRFFYTVEPPAPGR